MHKSPRARSFKASLATGFLILIGMTVSWVYHRLDDIGALELVGEHATEDTLPAAVKSRLGPAADSFTSDMLKAVGEDDQTDETILNQTGFEDPSAKNKPKHLPRVFDMILLNDELDMLEIRVNELASVVDVFFILEAEYTFSGKPKPLYFSDHETRFRQFRDKIIHIVIPRLTPDEEEQYAHYGAWANEKFARNKGLKIATDSRKPNDGDWIIL